MKKHGVIKENGMYVAYVDGVQVGNKGGYTYGYQAQKAVKEHGDTIAADTASLSIPVATRFGFVTSLVRMVATGQTPSMILCGDGGLGKSFTVTEALHELGFQPKYLGGAEKGRYYTLIKARSTAKAIYTELHNDRDGLFVFDDCDDALKDPDAKMVMKAALDSCEKRVVCWGTSGMSDLDPSFIFTGGAIFISNMALGRVDQAIRTRSMCVDLAMTLDQKIERMTMIASSPSFMPSVGDETKRSALSLIAKNKENAAEISLRSLIKVAKILNSGEKNSVELAEYALLQG